MKDKEYCCKWMKELDEKEIIDYCPPHLTTLDINNNAYPIYFCPFCGEEIEGSKETVEELKRRREKVREGKVISTKELKQKLKGG